MKYYTYVCTNQNLGTMSFTLQMVLSRLTFPGPEVCVKLLLFGGPGVWLANAMFVCCWGPLRILEDFVGAAARLHTWSAPRDVDVTFWAAPPGPQFLRKLCTDFHDAGPEIGAPPPEIGAQFGPRVGGTEPATLRLQACVPPTKPNSGGQHGHASSFATWPSPPAPARPNPNSNETFGVWILEFGFWIFDFGLWILDLGFWILDPFSLHSFCGSPKRLRLDFGVWILGLD